jgi:RimJ/RimL family protein N-acetyltransferase
MAAMSLDVRRLETADAASHRELRLEGLKAHPEAFGASWEEEWEHPVAWWAERLDAGVIYGGGVDGSPLIGVAGLHVQKAIKQRHKALLWGMYVRPEGRGMGLGAALVQRVIDHARDVVEELSLTVGASNTAARSLYSAAGFKEYGLEQRGLKVGDRYYDEVLMALSLRPVR